MVTQRHLLAACLLIALAPVAHAAVPVVTGHVVLNEVLYNPAGRSEAGHEAVELYDPTPLPVDLTGWTVGDDDPNCHATADAPYPLPLNGTLEPQGLLVVTFPAGPTVFRCDSLANSGDVVMLRNATGGLVDAVCWGTGCSSHPEADHAPLSGDGLSVQRCYVLSSQATLADGSVGNDTIVAANATLGSQNAPCTG